MTTGQNLFVGQARGLRRPLRPPLLVAVPTIGLQVANLAHNVRHAFTCMRRIVFQAIA
jgi:hypothetical protein